MSLNANPTESVITNIGVSISLSEFEYESVCVRV